jgi:GT2 family glycosyltransferase
MTTPRFTVAIPAHDCARYVGDTLRSVLDEQVPPARMQIVVVDDGSTDETAAVVADVGGARVELHRQANQGLARTFNTCVAHARGELVHLLHGDDKVLPGFYARVDEVFARHHDVGMFTARCREIDGSGAYLGHSYLPPPLESGRVERYERRIVPRNHVRTPGVVLRREVYERQGGYDERLGHTADWHMWLRACEWGPVWHEVTACAEYRLHAGSDTSKKVLDGTYLLEVWKAVAFWADRLAGGAGLAPRHAIERAVVRAAVNDVSAGGFDGQRRRRLEEMFAAHVPHLATPVRDALARRFAWEGRGPAAAPRRVAIFGAGAAGRRAAAALDPSRNEIVAFLDNNPARHGELVLGAPAVAPDRLLHLDYDHVIVASVDHVPMAQQLRHLGVDMRDVAVWTP